MTRSRDFPFFTKAPSDETMVSSVTVTEWKYKAPKVAKIIAGTIAVSVKNRLIPVL